MNYLAKSIIVLIFAGLYYHQWLYDRNKKYYLDEKNWPIILKQIYYNPVTKRGHVRNLYIKIELERNKALKHKPIYSIELLKNVKKLQQLLWMIEENDYEKQLMQLSSTDRYLDDWDIF